MKKIFLSLFYLTVLMLLSQLFSQNKNPLQSYQQLYIKAETLFDSAATDSADSIALNYYLEIIQQLQSSSSSAELLYNCYERIGILEQGLGYDSKKILQNYYAALSIQKNYKLNDSILFRLLLSAGNVHYADGLFDSSVFYFSKAENIINKFPDAGLAGDLYNSLGALYNEVGNYVQSGIYFNKALELTRKTRPDLQDAIFAMSSNVASAVKASGYLDSALRLYKKLLDVSEPSLPVINNIANIFLEKKQADSALYFLQFVKNIKGDYSIAIHNAFAQAYMLKNDTAQAFQQLTIAASIYDSIPYHSKNNFYAATCKYFGDLMMTEQQPQQALNYYQRSLIQYDFKFNDENIFVNPGNFIGEFASYDLFGALAAKANCLSAVFNKGKYNKYFQAAKSTYDSAFALSDYIKKSIDNDQARLFIADKVFPTYIKAVDFILRAKDDDNIKLKALEWISKSRATSLAISLKENAIKQYAGLPDSLLQKEKNLRLSISRLELQQQQTNDTNEQNNLLSLLNTASLQLQSLDNVFKIYPNYYRQKFAADNIDIRSIQRNVLNDKSAAICYFKSDDNIYAFVIEQNKIVLHKIKTDSFFVNNITLFVEGLSNNNAGEFYNNIYAKNLYKLLITPLQTDLKNITSLIIIPDQELINIPFEAFQTNTNKYLIEDFDITYQYALPFLQKDTLLNNEYAIAFAPFASKNVNSDFAVLNFSTEEISVFKKQSQFINTNATKNKFLQTSVKANLIHLATHAAVNYNEPAESYIAFYPSNNIDTTYKMYARELYNLQLTKTKLVFLSACETGSGKVSQSEGALSLARAFAFAGCSNIITSLWKAEDKSTAYISERFYKYLDKGYSYAEALQNAKTDLLHDATMSQFHSPKYWSHLIFIGDVQRRKSKSSIWISFLTIFVLAVLIFVFTRKVKLFK